MAGPSRANQRDAAHDRHSHGRETQQSGDFHFKPTLTEGLKH